MCRLFDQAIRYRQAHKFRPTTVSLLEVDYFGRQFFFWYRLRLFPWFVRLAISHSLFLCQKSSTIFRRYPTVVRKIRWWYLLQRLVWLMSTILIPFWLLWSIWGENVFVASPRYLEKISWSIHEVVFIIRKHRRLFAT